MAVPLIIIESRAKINAIRDQLKGEAEFLLVGSPPMKVSFASSESSPKGGGIDFAFSPLPQEKDFVEALQAARGREIFVALNSDAQGEYWAWMISGYLAKLTGGGKVPYRLYMFGLCREDLLEDMRQAAPVSVNAGAVVYIRMLFNNSLLGQLRRLIGTQVGPGNFPLNYASLTGIFLLVERETEIRLYSPPKKWQVRVKLTGATGEFVARLEEAPGIMEGGYFKEAASGREAVNLFKDLLFEVTDVEKHSLSVPAPAPFRITDLLTDAYLRFKTQPQDVLTAVRRLFCGVVVDGDTIGLVSSFLVQKEGRLAAMEERLRDQVAKEFGADQLTDEVVRLTGDEGFLFPLRPSLTAKDLAGLLPDDCLRIYELIRLRAMACQMIEAGEETIDVLLKAGPDCRFQATGRVVTQKGYRLAYQEPGEMERSVSSPLGALVAGQTASLANIIPEQTSDFPVEYYSFDSLFSDLADFSIAPDFSSIQMLHAMLNTGYLSLGAQGELRAGENAFKVVDTMKRVFPSMYGISLSAYLEQTTEEAVSGRKELAFALRQFEQTMIMQGNVLVKADISAKLLSRKKSASRIIVTPGPETVAQPPGVDAAPSDEAPLSVPPAEAEVRDAEPGVEVEIESAAAIEVETAGLAEAVPLEEAEVADLEPETVLPSVAEAVDPEEVFGEPEPPLPPAPATVEAGGGETVSPQKPLVEAESGAEAGILCPVCKHSRVINKRTPTGKDFFVCPNEGCEFMAWSKPHAVPCQVCNSPFLVEKKNLRGQKLLRCPRAGCNYMEPMPGEEIGDAAGGGRRLVRRVVRKGGAKRKVVVRRR